MEFVSQESVTVILVLSEIYAINCHVIHDALNMVNAKMALVSALRDGMAVIALCVSILGKIKRKFLSHELHRKKKRNGKRYE